MAHAGGRPSKYQEKLHCQIARLGVRACLTEKEIAGEIGVSESTLSLWKLEHPEFSEVLKKARLPLIEEVERAHFRSALGFRYKARKPMTKFVGDGIQEIEIIEYQEYVPPNITAQIHILKKRKSDIYGDKVEDIKDDDKTLTIRFE